MHDWAVPGAFSKAVCRKPQYAPRRDRPSLWETIPDARFSAVVSRFQQAQKLCLECPVIDLCRERLRDLEANRVAIDGVVAARMPAVHTNRYCRRCERPLLPRDYMDDPPHGYRIEYRRAYCQRCYRIDAAERAARKHKKSSGRGK